MTGKAPIRWKHLASDPVITELAGIMGVDPHGFCDAHGVRVKDGIHRTVWRIAGPWGTIHVKKNPLHNWRALARRLVRPSKAEMEAINAIRLNSRGIGTLEILGFGEENHFGGSAWLVTRSIEDAIQLDHALRDAGPEEQRRIGRQLAAFLARLHSFWAFHPDLHPANILLDKNGIMYLLDIHNLAWLVPTVRRRINNLVILNRWFQNRCGATDRHRFFMEYCRNWREYDGKARFDPRELARRIEAETHLSNQDLWRKRDFRCLGSNSEFAILKDNGFYLNISRNMPEGVLEILSQSPPRWRFKAIFKASKSSTVGLVQLGGAILHGEVVAKLLPHGRVILDWIRSFWELPGQRAWRIAFALLARGLPTPKPLGYSLAMSLMGGDERLVIEYLSQSRQLDVWWKDCLGQEPRLRHMTIVLGKLIRRMHAQGVRHRDLKAANFLVDQMDNPWIVDLAGADLFRVVPEKIKMKDLARIGRSATVAGLALTAHLRFFKAYAGGCLFPDWKEKWRSIARMVIEGLLRQERLGRPSG